MTHKGYAIAINSNDESGVNFGRLFCAEQQQNIDITGVKYMRTQKLYHLNIFKADINKTG